MYPKKILVLRFSAMGDVMLLVPVLRSLTVAYPAVEITLVTRPRFASFFHGIEGVKVFEADVDYTYSGVMGMRDLFGALLRKGGFDMVVDMHDHIRTMILRNLFKLFGTAVTVFEKGRSEKKSYTRRENKIEKPLQHTVHRYKAVFEKIGFEFPILPAPFLIPDAETRDFVDEWLQKKNLVKQQSWIGIAPFAKHLTKIWPTSNYAPLIHALLKTNDVKFFLFGGGKKEVEFFQNLHEQFPDHCIVVAEQMKIRHEIALMQYLDLMICVDSSNMHLAALSNTPLLSIWGGTHPNIGFAPFGGDKVKILQISSEELRCRPCSVYGKETCYVGGFPCLTTITVPNVAHEIREMMGWLADEHKISAM